MRLRKYGVEATIDFPVYGITGVDLKTDWTPAAADCELSKDGGVSTQCTNTASAVRPIPSIVLTATEMQAARLVLKIVDAVTKVFLDTTVVIETYGNASAQHAFDLDSAEVITDTASRNASKADVSGLAPAGEYDTELDANMSSRAPASEYDTEMARITANVAIEAKQNTAQTDLDIITGVDGVTLATLQALYAPNKVVPASLSEFNDRSLVAAAYTVVSDLGTVQTADHTAEIAKIPKSDSNVTWNATALASIKTQVTDGINTALPGTPTAGSLGDYMKRAKFAVCNKFEVDEDDGDNRVYDDSNTLFNTTALAFTSASTITKRLKIL